MRAAHMSDCWLHRAFLGALTACVMTVPAAAVARIECMNRGGDALPADAYAVPVSRAPELQRLLAEHGRIRLDPAGDYRKATGITIHSGQAIFGAAGTRIGRLIVAPGTSGAILSGVVPDVLEFPSSTLVTHDNCFERFAARTTPQLPLKLANTFVENNLFLDVGQLLIDTSYSGSVTNNRFIRTTVHGSSPALQLLGRDASSGDRNVFLWTNILSAAGDAIVIDRQAEVNFIGVDAEDWNHSGLAARSAMFTATRTGTLRVFMAQGGVPKATSSAFMDVDAGRFELAGLRLYLSGEPAIRLRAGAKEFTSTLASESRLRNESPDSVGWTAYPDWTERVVSRGTMATASTADATRALAWEAPEFAAIPNPAGVDWRSKRLQGADSTAQLQGMIDAQGIALLPAGVFYISAPLRLKSGQGIVGAGTGRTVIVAKSDDIDLIVGDDHATTPHPMSMVLVDITLQGGRAGIRHDAHGSGTAQYVYTQLSHVVFRDMTEAGIVIDGIYGWDNNLLDELTFYRVPVGIQQKPNPEYISAEVSGNAPGTNYLDKNVCYRCRFEDVDTGLELIAKRANNLNACVNCRFVRNRRGAIRLKYNASTVIANSDFIDNGGDPVITSDQPVGIVSSRFVAARAGSLLDGDAICDACDFTAASGSHARVVRTGARAILMNSTAAGIVLGDNVPGLLVDSRIPGAATARLLQLSKSGQSILSKGDPLPAGRLLVEWGD